MSKKGQALSVMQKQEFLLFYYCKDTVKSQIRSISGNSNWAAEDFFFPVSSMLVSGIIQKMILVSVWNRF